MTAGLRRGHALRSKALVTSGLLVLLALGISAVGGIPAVSAQTTEYTVATPSYINLGMNTSISVTAPAAGSYTVVVESPTGTPYTVTDTFTAAGQVQTTIFGNATVGFKTVVSQVGTWSVYLEQGTAVVASSQTTFFATSKINISFDMLMAGACVFVPGGSRGQEMLAQFHVAYASNGATVENAATWVNKTFTTHGATVTFTLPDGTSATASLHAPSAATWNQAWYQGHVWPTWNTSWVGNYYPTAKASDQYGNAGTFTYSGYPYPIAAATLTTTISLSDAQTGAAITGLYNGMNAIVTANIQYTNPMPSADTVKGFAGPLDTATRGGVVTAVVGWGPYNAATGTFGSPPTSSSTTSSTSSSTTTSTSSTSTTTSQPGGLIATVPMTYSTTTKVWTGPLDIGTLPTLVGTTTYEVVVSSHDSAQPANTGFAILNLPPATVQQTTTTATSVSTITATASASGATSTATITSTVPGATSTATITSTAPGPTSTATITSTVPGATSTATSVSVVTSTKTAVSTTVQTNTVVPWWAYVLLVAFLVELGIPIGYAMRRPASGGQQASPKEE